MQSTDKTTIAMHTSIPGTHSQELLALRQKHVPRGVSNSVPVFVEKAEGAVVVDVDGNRMIDLAGAIGTLNAGHCPPRVVAALKAQLDQYIHPGFNVLMYEPYVRLAETLNALTPGDHEKRTFFLNSGAEAVENAVKIARKFTGRRGVLSFRGGFHGRTLLAMSLTSKVKPYKFGFGPFAADVYRLPYPNYYRAPLNMTPDQLDDALLSRMEEFFISDVPKEEIAAVIMEPVQGEGASSFRPAALSKGCATSAAKTTFCSSPTKCRPGSEERAGCLPSNISVWCRI
ncbi:hypothetical protein GCM10025857_25290 [Alicyclobacillus contaminans]|nr:hypothetical protein GCM10025857_25290 [Alicyclobacillus contaminans]